LFCSVLLLLLSQWEFICSCKACYMFILVFNKVLFVWKHQLVFIFSFINLCHTFVSECWCEGTQEDRYKWQYSAIKFT
jgi:hypothetical protein